MDGPEQATDEVRQMDVPVYNMTGDQVGSMTIDEGSLGGEVNPRLIKQAYVRYHSNRRQGSARTRSRGQIKSSNKKLVRQKGSGRARHGNRTVAQFRGGGRAFAKTRTREDFRQSMPRKMRRQANRNAMLAKLIDGEVKVLESLELSEPGTRRIVEALKALGVDRSALVAVSSRVDRARNVQLSCRNMDEVRTCRAADLNCFEMLNNRYLVIAKEDLEAWLTGPSSQTDKGTRGDPMDARGEESR